LGPSYLLALCSLFGRKCLSCVTVVGRGNRSSHATEGIEKQSRKDESRSTHRFVDCAGGGLVIPLAHRHDRCRTGFARNCMVKWVALW
jgi:hypothetical protein